MNKEDLQLPIYRAKKIDSDEYVEGMIDPYGKYILQEACGNIVIEDKEHFVYFSIEIDPSTLAMHFSDMIDSEGAKIFASLSEDGKGKGGDLFSVAKLSSTRKNPLYLTDIFYVGMSSSGCYAINTTSEYYPKGITVSLSASFGVSYGDGKVTGIQK